jgi:hypothetical protein
MKIKRRKRGKQEPGCRAGSVALRGSQQIWLVEGALLRNFRGLLDGLGALGDCGGLFLLGCGIPGHGTESQSGTDHQRHQFLHLAVLLWIAIIKDRLGS